MFSGRKTFWRKKNKEQHLHSGEGVHSEPSQELSSVKAPKKGRIELTLIHECAPPTDDQRSFPVDVVFVHGLNGDSIGTWTHESGIFWPKHLLPAELPGARIYSFGYESQIFSKHDGIFRDFAVELLVALRSGFSAADTSRPLVFVCHSLGGIVVKEAINIAYEREYHTILSRSRGIVFLGTPHRGSDAANLFGLVCRIIDATWTRSPIGLIVRGPRTELIRDLERNSKALEAIADRFIKRADSIKIASFYEKHVTLPLGKVVVDSTSGVLGLSHEERFPIPKNHHDICRFESRESVGYNSVVFAIREIITNIVPVNQDSRSDHSLTVSEKECLQQLNTVDVLEFESQIDARSPLTLLWLSEDVDYVNWLTKASTSLLLVTGYAGCGKTVLASYLRTNLGGAFNSSFLVCRFYCNALDAKMHSAIELVRNLIFQVVSDSYSQEMLRAVVKAANHDLHLWGSFDKLWSLFENIASSDISRTIIIIIDAIDELEDRIQRLITPRILRLVQSGLSSTIKFFITSQPQAPAVAELRRHSLCLKLETKHDLIGNDVDIYVKERVIDLAAQNGWTAGMRQRVVEELQSKAGQSFLWVAVTLSFLQQQDILTSKDLTEALATIPPTLTTFYERVTGSISNRKPPGPALRLFNMILSSKRPLHSKEIEVLLSIDESHESVAEVRRDSVISGVQSFQQILGPLVRCHSSKIQLVHTSLKDHLTQREGSNGLAESKGHEILAEQCIRYLLLPDFRWNNRGSSSSPELSTPSRSSSYSRSGNDDVDVEDTDDNNSLSRLFAEPENVVIRSIIASGPGYELYDYAIRFWAIHLERCQLAESSPVFSLAEKLYGHFSPLRWEEILRYTSEDFNEYPAEPDPLTLACYYKHDRAVQNYLARPNVNYHHVGKALHWAASSGHEACVELVCSHIRQQPVFDLDLCRVSGRSPLAAAALNGHIASITSLIASGLFKINEPDAEGLTALSHAATRGQEHLVAKMLSMPRSEGLEVNVVDNAGRTALFWACKSTSRKIVHDLLLDDRLDPNVKDIQGSCALAWACEVSFAEAVKLFVDNEAVHLGMQDVKGNTPLILAVKSGSFESVKRLLRQHARTGSGGGGDVNIAAKDASGRNAISWAASRPDSRILKTLLARAPGEASMPDENGWSPLAWSMDPPGYLENARMLIPHNAINANERSSLGTPLLSTAIIWGQLEIAKLLLEDMDVDLDQKDDSGRTALSYAASRGSTDIVRLLMTRGANATIADDAGKLPSDWARLQGHYDIADVLIRV